MLLAGKSYIIFVKVIICDLTVLRIKQFGIMAHNVLLSCCEYKSSNSFKIFLILELIRISLLICVRDGLNTGQIRPP